MPVLSRGRVQLYSGEDSYLGYIISPDFPWFYTAVTGNYGGMVHTLMHRNETCLDADGFLLPGHTPQRGIDNSPHLPAAEQLFLRICGDNNITVRTIYRAAFNRTFHEPAEHSEIHWDHRFPHKVFILYIYMQDGGDTLLFDSDYKLAETITAEGGEYVVFDGDLHAISFCKPHGTRVVMVVTFDGDVNE